MATASLDVLGLTPNQTYSIQVFATFKDSSGVTHTSNYSPALTITTPSLSASGANFTTTNYGTDIQLSGGSLFAGTFPSNIGQFDLTTTSPNGTGVVINQTGVGAYNSGVQEFFLNAKTGAATFAGTITTPTIQSANYSPSLATVEPKFSVAGTQISLTDGSISAPQFRITPTGSGYFGGDLSGSLFSGTGLGTYIGNAAQASANGKNVIHYGATAGTGSTSGFGPDGVLYYTSGGTPLFPSTITYGYANQQVGDTFFSYNSSTNIIAQYTATSGTSWSKTQISSQVISELDVGKLTAGTINAAISMTSATIIGGTIVGGTLSTFSGTNPASGVTGIDINKTNVGAINFWYGSTNTGAINVISGGGGTIFSSNGQIQLQGLSGNVTVTGGSQSLTNGLVRNIAMGTSKPPITGYASGSVFLVYV